MMSVVPQHHLPKIPQAISQVIESHMAQPQDNTAKVAVVLTLRLPAILMPQDLEARVFRSHVPTSPSSVRRYPAIAHGILRLVHVLLTKLQDLIKYDTPHLGPRIQLMLSQIQFKLNVEEQYLKGIEKMVQLYSMEGDRKSKADAAARKVESKQKILLLKQALKRYEELHIDADVADAQDGKFIFIYAKSERLTNY